jgi:hypothetical protein
MKKLILLLLTIVSQSAIAQNIIVGDSTNRIIENLNFTLADGRISFDFDCDGSPDAAFKANPSSCCNPNKIWSTTVLNVISGTEYVAAGPVVIPFSALQTFNPILLPSYFGYNGYWSYSSATLHLGGGGAGSTLDKEFIVFRKKNTSDTSYFFLKVTHFASDNAITFHKVISDCANTRILGSKEEFLKEVVKIYPNPFNSKLLIENKASKAIDLSIYNLQGKLIKEFKSLDQNSIDLTDLAKGAYLLKYRIGKKLRTEIFMKE